MKNQSVELLQRMIEFDAGDAKRIQHFLKVYEFASLIGRLEKLPADQLQVLELAAIVHDIGIHAAEQKYGSTSGIYQEREGQPLAETMLRAAGCEEDVVQRVGFLVGHHHTYTAVDGLDYQILLEADFLVNAYEDQLSIKAIQSVREKVFRTQSGRNLLDTIYGETVRGDKL